MFPHLPKHMFNHRTRIRHDIPRGEIVLDKGKLRIVLYVIVVILLVLILLNRY